MKYRKPQSIPPERRAELLDEARACGRMGARRPSDACLFGGGIDPSDTHVLRILEAFEEGKKERENG